PSQQELDLLFGPLYDEFFNAGSNLQDTQPTTNIQSTSAPSTLTYVHAEENNDDKAKEDQLPDDEFTNPFCASTQEVAETSSHNIEQVHGNPSRPVQTRRQLATDPEMYKMKEKGYLCILVGYSTQSKGYRVYNKRTRMIVESIPIRFDEIKEVYKTSVANDTSGLICTR
nr:Gag-Pol polyprotein [Tanacetum cinerariifolium]